MAEKFWKMQKAKEDDDSAEILFYGVIAEASSWFEDNITPKSFVDDLSDLGKVSTIKVRINSPGGDLFAGNAIYNILKNHKARIVSYVDGIAASAASVVLMAGDEIVSPRNGMVMIHNPSSAARGDARDFRKMADMLDKARETMLAIYEDRTGLDRTKLIGMLNSETWLPAKEAIELGFVDRIDEQVSISAEIRGENLVVNGCSFSVSDFGNIPETFAKPSNRKLPSISVSMDGDKTLFNLWQPFINNGVKEDERLVYGYSTLFGVEDYDDERMTREAIDKALPAYMENPIIDEVHKGRPVGEAPFLKVDDKGLLTGARIYDDAAWKKVKSKKYKGFSLDGEVLAVRESVIDGKLVTELVDVRIDAISLCDRPKCPGAVYQMVTNQGGKLVLCIRKGGEIDIMAENSGTQATQDSSFKAAVKDVLDWIKGEGKDEVTAALGIDMSNYATKDDISNVAKSIGDLTSMITDLVAKSEQPVAVSVEEPTAIAEPIPAAPEVSDLGELPKALEGIGDAIASLAKATEETASRVSQIETARGMRKSSDITGDESDDVAVKDEKLWGSALPKASSAS